MEYRSYIARFSDEIATLAEQNDFTLPIPSCPEWTLGDLVFHLGSVHATWTAIIEDASPDERTHHVVDDVADEELVEWFRGHTRGLLAAMVNAEPQARCWTWWGEPRTVRAVERHQVQEAAVHRWDVQNALHAPKPLEADVASDGIAEFLLVEREHMTAPAGARVTLRTIDTDEAWFVGVSGPHDVALSGSSSQLLLVLHGRAPIETLDVEGDVQVAQTWLSSIDLT